LVVSGSASATEGVLGKDDPGGREAQPPLQIVTAMPNTQLRNAFRVFGDGRCVLLGGTMIDPLLLVASEDSNGRLPCFDSRRHCERL
jgi:hypothetical protein